MTSIFISIQCIIKQLLDLVSDIQNNQGLGKGYHLRPTLIIYHKNLIQ